MNTGSLNGTGNSAQPNCLVTDANSVYSGDTRLQPNGSFKESYGRLRASPSPFASNNASACSVVDGSASLQHSLRQDLVQRQGASSNNLRLMEQDSSNLLNGVKKPMVGMRQEDIMQPHVIQQILQRQDSMPSQAHQNVQLQSMLQQHRPPLRQPPLPQQIVQPFSPMQRPAAPIAFQQQPQLRPNLQQHSMQPGTPVNRPPVNVICSRRLMQYLYHQRHRPTDNSISYWRKFIAEYFSPQAKERCCLSAYDNVGKHALGAFPQPAADSWQCDICGSKCGKGFEATFEILPRLYQIKFDHGVLDENLFLDMPHESRLNSGVMILEYRRVLQESAYEHMRIIREGTLRIIFTPELKIFRWDFCVKKHEELLPRRVMAPQVNQLLQVAQKYQNAVGNENGSAAVSNQDLQANCNMFMTAGRQLARSLELQSLNDLGFSKRYVRCLQISEVVSGMKDLIDFSREHKTGPIESLKEYTSQAMSKLQKQKMQESEQMAPSQNVPSDQNILNRVIGTHPGPSSQTNNNVASSNVLNVNQQNMAALNNYQNLLKNSVVPNQNQNQHMLQQEVSAVSSVKQARSLQFQGSASIIPPNTFANNTSCQYQQQPPINGGLPQQNNIHPSQVKQQMQQQAIQQMLQEMVNNNRGTPNTSYANGNLASCDATDFASRAMPVKTDSGPGNISSEMPNFSTRVLNSSMGDVQTNNFSSASGSHDGTSNSFGAKSDLGDCLDFADFDHLAQEFTGTGMFDGVGEDGDTGFDWKV